MDFLARDAAIGDVEKYFDDLAKHVLGGQMELVALGVPLGVHNVVLNAETFGRGVPLDTDGNHYGESNVDTPSALRARILRFRFQEAKFINKKLTIERHFPMYNSNVFT